MIDIMSVITIVAPLLLHLASTVFNFVIYLKNGKINQQIKSSTQSSMQPKKDN